jgi:1-acyl-sn-glycerol-3-phosphate acyltransferase
LPDFTREDELTRPAASLRILQPLLPNAFSTGPAAVQDIVIEKPYAFIPPYHSRFMAMFLQTLIRRRLRRVYGIVEVESHGLERLRASLDAGHGIMLTPNHPRYSDPFVVGELARQVGTPLYTVASWHLFMQGRLQAWLLRQGGVFSIYREGMDRASISTAIDVLESAKRPLLLFPEGVMTRTNDRLSPLLEGTAFIARAAAKKRASATPAGQVVIHPVALRYTFHGDIAQAVGPTLDELERRLSWLPQHQSSLLRRIAKLAEALVTLKEIEYLDKPETGNIYERLQRLIDHLLRPIEQEWVKGKSEGSVVVRVKKLRAAMLPEMIQGDITEEERQRRWRQLAAMYLAQQLWYYPPDYLTSATQTDRLLETVERFEEDLTDKCRTYRPMKVTATIGEAIPVSTARDRGAAEDPLMAAVEASIKQMLGI